jgi:hypothetical protein
VQRFAERARALRRAYAAPMAFAEDREFTLRIEIRCAFPDDYEGEADGFAWWDDVEPIMPEVVRAAAEVLRRRAPEWRVRPANRGRPNNEEVTLVVEREMDGK